MTDELFSSADRNHHNADDPASRLEADNTDRELLAFFEEQFQEGDSLSLENESVGDIDFEAIARELEQESLSENDIAPLAAEKVMELVEIPATEPSEPEKPWFNLAQKLREQNQILIQRVVELERVLSDAKQRYQDETRRSRSLDGAILAAQAQLQDLRDQLVVSQQESQQQRLQLETLTEQSEQAQTSYALMERNFIEQQESFSLQAHQIAQLTEALALSHSRSAQLERTCANLQEEINSKTHQLVHLEAQLPELRSRLQRQQRFALEYKAALDRALASHNQSSAPPNASSAIPMELEEDSLKRPETIALTPETASDLPAAIATSAVEETATPEPVSHYEVEPLAPTAEEASVFLPEETNEVDRFIARETAEEQVVESTSSYAAFAPNLVPLPQSSNHTYARRVVSSPSFSISPQVKPKPAQPTKKVELPAFLRGR